MDDMNAYGQDGTLPNSDVIVVRWPCCGRGWIGYPFRPVVIRSAQFFLCSFCGMRTEIRGYFLSNSDKPGADRWIPKAWVRPIRPSEEIAKATEASHAT